MIDVLLAGVLMSGSITQSVARTQGHVNSPSGGTVVRTAVTTTKTWPPLPAAQTLGTQTVHVCSFSAENHQLRVITYDPRGCAYALGGSNWTWVWF